MNKTITLILSIMLKSFTAHLVKRPFMGVLTIAVIMILTNCGGGGGNDEPDYRPSFGTSKCNEVSYNPSVYRCESGELIGKCKGEDYYAAYEQCVNGVIVPGSSLSSSSGDNSSKKSSSSGNNNSSGGSSVVSSSSTGSSSNNGSSSSKGSSSSVNGSSSSSSATGVDLCNGFVDGAEREHYGIMKEQFCDSRDGKKYFYVEIGDQTWMAENLNYNAANSRCYGDNTGGDSQGNCTTYGRLYDWATAMALSSSCNSTTCSGQVSAKHQGVCPNGWHIPSNDDWGALMTAVGGSSTASPHLKTTSGWDLDGRSYGNGVDTYGFSALPGGYGYSSTVYRTVGDSTFWFSASEYNSISACFWKIDHYYDFAISGNAFGQSDWNIKPRFFSVRCLKD